MAPKTYRERRPHVLALRYDKGAPGEAMAFLQGRNPRLAATPNPDASDDIVFDVFPGTPGGPTGVVMHGEWLIRDANGSISSCPADTFESLFEESAGGDAGDAMP
jgi:hypothetical protein